MKNVGSFIDSVIRIAQQHGYKIEINRKGQRQIDFGNKKLHEGHLDALFPDILTPDIRISHLIESVAPGRPCAHRPMKAIIAQMHSESEVGK